MHLPSPIALSTPLPPSPRKEASPPAFQCELLLRDTLRRAEEHRARRVLEPQPYHPADVFIAEAIDCCERDGQRSPSYLRRASGSAHKAMPSTVDNGVLQRSLSLGHRHSQSLSSIAPPPLRHPTPIRPGPVTSQSDLSPAPSRSQTPLQPHERALRSRLIGVLASQPVPPPTTAARSLRAVTVPVPSALAVPAPPSLSSSPSETGSSPLPTPPQTPAFDARTASAFCRAAPGYVSFADIEGLGAPPLDDDDDESTQQQPPRWWDLTTWWREKTAQASEHA